MHRNQVLSEISLVNLQVFGFSRGGLLPLCDPPVTPAFALLLTNAAAALGGLGSDAVTTGESVVSHVAMSKQ